jgi:hypothetical protein
MEGPPIEHKKYSVPGGLAVGEVEPRRREGREGLSESGSEGKPSPYDSHKEPISQAGMEGRWADYPAKPVLVICWILSDFDIQTL